MGVLTKSADTVYTMRFLRLLTTPWEETNAFKLGIIDDEGKKIKKPTTEKEKSSYNLFHRLVFNIKKAINKIPGGKTKIASYATAFLLLKEHFELTDESIEKILDLIGVNHSEYLGESTQWYQTEDGMLSPGVYKLAVEDKMINTTFEEFGKKNDKILVEMDNYPVGNILGLEIYEVIHTPTRQKMYVTAGELIK